MKLFDIWDNKAGTEIFNPDFQWSVKKYHSILCSDFPDFLDEYIQLPFLQRLEGVGLLCGTDWTKLFHNRFYYSRLNHSVGTALITWNFTHSKKQSIASLLHDISTPAFSHVNDFRCGDALTQESTEDLNIKMINEYAPLKELLEKDGLNLQEMNDYHKYPVADNKMPCLSADRLEYMFPSGASLTEEWTLSEIENEYSTIKVLKNEKGIDELGFTDLEAALEYTKKFCSTGLILQRNEDKLSMELLGKIISLAIKNGFLSEDDLYIMSEDEIIALFDEKAELNYDEEFSSLFETFRTMEKIIHSQEKVENCFCVNLNVKKRYINPLVKCGENAKRLSLVSKEGIDCIENFLSFNDTPFGCVPIKFRN